MPRLYRSVDGGISWVDRTPMGGDGPFEAISIHPANRDILFTAARRAVFFANNGGMSWVRLPDPSAGVAASAESIQDILLPVLPPAVNETVGSGMVDLVWSLPGDSRFQGVMVRGAADQTPHTSIEGSLLDTIPAPGNSK